VEAAGVPADLPLSGAPVDRRSRAHRVHPRATSMIRAPRTARRRVTSTTRVLADRVARTSVVPGVPGVPTSVVPGVPTSVVPVVPTSVVPVARTSVPPTTTIGDHRGIPVTTTGTAVGTGHPGVRGRHRGAGARRRHRPGTDHCQTRGVRHRRRSTTGASRSSRYGIRATTSGASTSSESGSRCPSSQQSARTAASSSTGRSSSTSLQ
jgi:hypothetical protein